MSSSEENELVSFDRELASREVSRRQEVLRGPQVAVSRVARRIAAAVDVNKSSASENGGAVAHIETTSPRGGIYIVLLPEPTADGGRIVLKVNLVDQEAKPDRGWVRKLFNGRSNTQSNESKLHVAEFIYIPGDQLSWELEGRLDTWDQRRWVQHGTKEGTPFEELSIVYAGHSNRPTDLPTGFTIRRRERGKKIVESFNFQEGTLQVEEGLKEREYRLSKDKLVSSSLPPLDYMQTAQSALKRFEDRLEETGI